MRYVAPLDRCLPLLLLQAAARTPQDTSACTPAVEEQPKEDGEDFEGLSSVLEHLGLSEYKSTFDNEKIDLESFVRAAGFFVSRLCSVGFQGYTAAA